MAKRQKVWAAKARDALMAKLGGKCVKCGATDNLTFDCKIPQGHEHHRMSFDRRMSFIARRTKSATCNYCVNRTMTRRETPSSQLPIKTRLTSPRLTPAFRFEYSSSKETTSAAQTALQPKEKQNGNAT